MPPGYAGRMSPEARLTELGIVLPPPREPGASYLPHKQVGQLLYLAGQGCREAGGPLLTGRLGEDVDVAEGARRARLAALMLLTTAREALGTLDRVESVVKLTGMVNATSDFVEHPAVVNGASDLFIEVFGDAGRHPRSAFGVATLVRNATVEIDVILQVRD